MIEYLSTTHLRDMTFAQLQAKINELSEENHELKREREFCRLCGSAITLLAVEANEARELARALYWGTWETGTYSRMREVYPWLGDGVGE